MLNPDYIDPMIGIPIGIILWLILFAMILWDRRKLNKALRERPTLKVLKDGEWVDVDGQPDMTLTPGIVKRHSRAASNFYNQDEDKA